MSVNKYITASCVISGNAVYKNAEKIIENKEAAVASFLLSIYQQEQIKYPKFYKMDNLSKLGWLTTEILLSGNFKKTNYNKLLDLLQ